jgi:hypothetical protein
LIRKERTEPLFGVFESDESPSSYIVGGEARNFTIGLEKSIKDNFSSLVALEAEEVAKFSMKKAVYSLNYTDKMIQYWYKMIIFVSSR